MSSKYRKRVQIWVRKSMLVVIPIQCNPSLASINMQKVTGRMQIKITAHPKHVLSASCSSEGLSWIISSRPLSILKGKYLL